MGDDTDGHIDELARFVGPRTVVAAVEPDPQDENYEPLADNFGRLPSATDAQGKRSQVIPIVCPRPLFYDGQRLPASYMNFYIANGVVLVPVFDDSADLTACDTWPHCFPAARFTPCGRSIWLGAWEPITASRSSSRPWPASRAMSSAAAPFSPG